MRILGMIPARGGSKGIPRKNLAPILGRPLLAYTADASLNARLLDRVVLSTDDDEIAEVGRRLGLEVPFMRPTRLAQDETPTIAVVRHVLETDPIAQTQFDAVCLLQPTAPLRTSAMIDKACAEFSNSGADSLVSVVAVPHQFHPDWVLVKTETGALRWASGDAEPPGRRQDLTPAFHRDGSIYITRTSILLEHDSLYGQTIRSLELDAHSHVNVDSPSDIERAETLLRARNVSGAGEQ